MSIVSLERLLKWVLLVREICLFILVCARFSRLMLEAFDAILVLLFVSLLTCIPKELACVTL